MEHGDQATRESPWLFACQAHASVDPVDNPQSTRLAILQKQKQWYVVWTEPRGPRGEDAANGSSQAQDVSRQFQLDALIGLRCCESREKTDVISVQFWVDGQTSPLFYLSQADYDNFMNCLKLKVSLKRTDSKGVYIFVNDKSALWNKEAALFKEENAADLLTRFTRNPYTTTMTSLAKFKDFFADLLSPNWMVDLPANDPNLYWLNRCQQDAWGTFCFQVDNDFQLVNQAFELPERPILERNDPLTEEEWNSFKNEDGSVRLESKLKFSIFRGGVEPSLRKEVWKYLLGVYEWSWSGAKCAEHQACMQRDYETLKTQWTTVSADQESRWSDRRKFRDLIEKDVARTDRNLDFFKEDSSRNLTLLHDILMTYVMYNFDLGYVQGMSDLLAPLLYIFGDEVDSFWAFVGFMRRVGGNFQSDQLCIKTQLRQLKCLLEVLSPQLSNYFRATGSHNMFFCFRWVLILFKREFSFEDIFLLWEVLWTDLMCPNFHLLVCLAILETQRVEILTKKLNFSDILKHVNNLSMNIDVNEVLAIAEGTYHQLAAVQNELPQEIARILNFHAHE